MPAEQGDHEGPPLVQHQHRRVRPLVLHMGGDGPDGDAAGADEDEGVRLFKCLSGPIRG